MKMLGMAIAAAGMALALLAVGQGEAHQGHAHRGDVAKFGLRFRTSTMQALSIHMGLLAAEKKGEIKLSPEDRRAHGDAVRALSGLIVDLFQQDTSATTRAKPEIWTDWERFAAMSKEMEAASASLARAASGGERAEIDAAIDAAGKTCGTCHKAFRKPRHRR